MSQAQLDVLCQFVCTTDLERVAVQVFTCDHTTALTATQCQLNSSNTWDYTQLSTDTQC